MQKINQLIIKHTSEKGLYDLMSAEDSSINWKRTLEEKIRSRGLGQPSNMMQDK